jgi:hypothetical protein
MEAPPLWKQVLAGLLGSLLLGVAASLVTFWRADRQPPCDTPSDERVDARVEVTEVADRLVVTYFAEKGPQETQAEFELTPGSAEGFSSGDLVRARSRLLKVAEDPSRTLPARFVTAVGEVEGGMLTVTACVDPSDRVALRGGVYTGSIVIGGPSSRTIDVPIEVNYRSRLSLLVIAAAPLFGLIVAWTLFSPGSTAPLDNWWSFFVAGTAGTAVGWWTYLEGDPGFSGTSLWALVLASWAGAAGGGTGLLALAKGKMAGSEARERRQTAND